MAKKFDPKAKAKRQKIMVAVGGVILLGLLAFQVPRTMKMLNQKGVDAAAPASTTATSTTPLPSSGSTATPVSAGATGDGLVDPDSVPAPQSGQLLAFSRFRSKDPFSQQLDLTCAEGGTSSEGSTGSGCGSGSGSGSTPAASPAKGKKEPAAPSSEAGSVAPAGPPAATAPKPTTATISVNGESESVKVGAQFPASNPTFTLVSLTKTSARVGIAGGSFESGGATVTLQKNKPLTLMNTADGTRYVLRLISIG
ncbi:MAG TPA: hypothetical protein VGJ40_03245 [Gaiellaceae bacterium]|jgi:hypothetical protein